VWGTLSSATWQIRKLLKRKKYVTCDRCGCKRKSAVGFISHRKICDPSLKISEPTAEREKLNNEPNSGGESSLKWS
jgi:hypothetical protein